MAEDSLSGPRSSFFLHCLMERRLAQWISRISERGKTNKGSKKKRSEPISFVSLLCLRYSRDPIFPGWVQSASIPASSSLSLRSLLQDTFCLRILHLQTYKAPALLHKTTDRTNECHQATPSSSPLPIPYISPNPNLGIEPSGTRNISLLICTIICHKKKTRKK